MEEEYVKALLYTELKYKLAIDTANGTIVDWSCINLRLIRMNDGSEKGRTSENNQPVPKRKIIFMKKFESIVILIPAYMPSHELITITEALLTGYFSKIVVVDDGSGSEFVEVFAGLPSEVILLRHSENRGKGSALRTGLAYIYTHCEECLGVITCDADGQHRPGDIYKVAESLAEQQGMPALVLGSRAFKGNVPIRSAFGNTVTRDIYFLASGIRLRDTQTGLRAFPYHMIPCLLKIPGQRYEYEINMLLAAAKQKIKIVEVEIDTVYISGNQSSHFHAIRDSAIIYGNIIKFSLSSLICFGIDFLALFLFRYLTGGLDGEISLLVSVVGARGLSSLINFCLNKNLVFKKSSKHALFKYYALALSILGMNYSLLYILNLLLGIPLFWAKLMTETFLFIISYAVQKKMIFKQNLST